MSEFEDKLWQELLRRHGANLASTEPPPDTPRRPAWRRAPGRPMVVRAGVALGIGLVLIPSAFGLPGGATPGATGTNSTPAPPDLSITKSGSPEPVVSGHRLTYTITATNFGTQSANGVTVTDPFSGNEHLNLVSASTTQGTCTTKGATVKCSVATLSGGSNATITIVAIATKPGTFSNTATVTASNVTGDPDDSATAMTTVIGA